MVQSGFELGRRQTGILREIVMLVLPEYPDLDAAARQTVEQEVTGYVTAQIASMPSFLRFPYQLALFGFYLLPLFRYGRSFSALPRDRRVSYVALWNDAPLAPMRDFVKLIRSTSLLVYFDHPAVRERLDAERRRTRSGQRRQASNA